MNQSLPEDLDRESLNQLSKSELVEIIIEQSKVIRELQKIIKELQQEIERLKVSRDLYQINMKLHIMGRSKLGKLTQL